MEMGGSAQPHEIARVDAAAAGTGARMWCRCCAARVLQGT